MEKPGHEDHIHRELEKARKELLDLTLRNPLLNYRLLKSRGVELVSCSSRDIYELLLAGNSLRFSAKSEDDNSTQQELFVGEPDPGEDQDETDSVDKRILPTECTSDELQARLVGTYRTARSYLEEQGVNTLYLAIGMLQWYEDDHSGILREAPLVLIPVSLERSNVKERFRLTFTNEDVEYNLSLAMKLREDFATELPPLPDDDEEDDLIDIEAYFAELEKAIKAHPRWSVNKDRSVIGFFSFSKLLMYRDLDSNNWPSSRSPLQHKIICSLLDTGFQEPPPVVPEDEHVDRYVKPQDLYHVRDADSSQAVALLDVTNGRNIVIQGPPGTGKSQTITNLIAEEIGRGKKVLFVAEKMAALEVVKRRLEEVGLGDACLELHSRKAHKKAVLHELKRTWDLGEPKRRQNEVDFETLTALRDQLNAYVEAVNTEIEDSGIKPYEAYGELLRADKVLKNLSNVPVIKIEGVGQWNKALFTKKQFAVMQLQNWIREYGSPAQHPYWGGQIRALLRTDAERVNNLIGETQDRLADVVKHSKLLEETLSMSRSKTVSEIWQVCNLVRLTARAPVIQGINFDSEMWTRIEREDSNVIKTGQELQQLHTDYDDIVLSHAWNHQVAEFRTVLHHLNKRVWRIFSRSWYQARRMLRDICKDKPPQDHAAQLALLDAITRSQELRGVVQESSDLGSELFGPHWQGVQSDWSLLENVRKWMSEFGAARDANQEIPDWSTDFVKSKPKATEAGQLVTDLEEALTSYLDSLDQLQKLLEINESNRLEALPINVQERQLEKWSRNTSRLQDIVRFNNVAELLEEEALEGVLDAALDWPQAGEVLNVVFTKVWYEFWLRRAFQDRSELGKFDGIHHNQVINKFCELDEISLELNRIRVARAHWSALPGGDGMGQTAVLKRQFVRKRGHYPIRKLMNQAGMAIQAIKPVFMMSPQSIANFLPPGALEFDMIIFDEASQVRPADAFGAILRGNQVVVAGDSMQLPPTTFFDALTSGSEEDDEDAIADIESILGLFVAQGAPERMLKWHYRSQHESLIAVSNHEFYNNSLIIYPSPYSKVDHLGLKIHHMPETEYDRGKSRTNREEARAVARAVIDHAEHRSDLTLGVAAFSSAQMRAIEDELELLRRENPHVEDFFNDHPSEPFFVKNLETVQGDERDVIIISVGYGRTSEGRVMMDFGPLNQSGGERRLNVLITRAKKRSEVFTNLKAEDFDLSRTNARGVKGLKTFLEYAETGRLPIASTNDEPEAGSVFEEAVCQVLAEEGFEVRKQVGTAGYFIDLAIPDPKRPGKYVLGIECDGATYHSARSARDRDRLRQKVLENLGWNIYRIWSTDWFQRPDRERKKVVEAINKALVSTPPHQNASNSSAGLDESQVEPDHIDRNEGQSKANLTRPIPPYIVAQLQIDLPNHELHSVPTHVMADWVTQVASVEGPVHISEVARRIASACGVKRVGRRIRDKIMYAAQMASGRRGKIIIRGEFLWPREQQRSNVRDRSPLPTKMKDIELIAPEEIAEAVLIVVADSIGIAQSEVVSTVTRILGFNRTGERISETILSIVSQLIYENRLELVNDHLQLVSRSNDSVS